MTKEFYESKITKLASDYKRFLDRAHTRNEIDVLGREWRAAIRVIEDFAWSDSQVSIQDMDDIRDLINVKRESF